jgi:hypothetical protein
MCWNDLGPAGARDLLNNTQIIINYWLLHNGFSVGVSDIVASQVSCDWVRWIRFAGPLAEICGDFGALRRHAITLADRVEPKVVLCCVVLCCVMASAG